MCYNNPYMVNISTNIGNHFLQILDREFSPGSKISMIFIKDAKHFLKPYDKISNYISALPTTRYQIDLKIPILPNDVTGVIRTSVHWTENVLWYQ